MTGAEWIARALWQAGYRHIFLMPNNLMATMVELTKMGALIVLGHSEKSAAYMADGFAKATGRPGLVVTQGGPGATNLVAGLADAYQAHSPVIALTRLSPASSAHRDAYQDMHADFSHVTRLSAELTRAVDVPRLLNQAFREATSGPPRPVHLAILPQAERGSADLPEARLDARFTKVPPLRPEPDGEEVQRAARLLLRARRPVMVVGGGAIISRAWEAVISLAEHLEMPVATSLSGKGVIPENHPLSVGVMGSYARSCANDIVGGADLVFFVGTHCGGQVSHSWTIPPLGTPAIQVDINPAQLGKNYPIKVGMAGDARATLELLTEEVANQRKEKPDRAWAAHTNRAVKQWWSSHAQVMNSHVQPIRPERLCRELSQVLPDETVVVADTGYAAAWAGTYWETQRPGVRFIRCEGSLGWGFPAALGVKCAVQDGPVVCITGDGGFWYHIAELETAARLSINTITIVLNNHSLAFEAHISDSFFGGLGHNFTDYLDVNFATIAQTCGVEGERVTDPGKLRPALQRALQASGPTLLDVVIDPEARAPVTGGVFLA